MEGTLQLRDRTVVLTGPLTRVHQAIVNRLTGLGANVALLGAEAQAAERFTSQIMDLREVHAHQGRAGSIPVDFHDTRSIAEAMSRTAESFGGIDIYIDGWLAPNRFSFAADNFAELLQSTVEYELLATIKTTQAALPFLKGRRRGRIIYLVHDLYSHGHPDIMLNAATRTGLFHFARALGNSLRAENIGVNCLRLGLTEESLLQLYPGQSVAEAESQLVQQFPRIEMSRPEDIANFIAFLASPLSQTLSGQNLSAHRGFY